MESQVTPKPQGGNFHESKTFGKTDLRKMQSHQAQGKSHGDL